MRIMNYKRFTLLSTYFENMKIERRLIFTIILKLKENQPSFYKVLQIWRYEDYYRNQNIFLRILISSSSCVTLGLEGENGSNKFAYKDIPFSLCEP